MKNCDAGRNEGNTWEFCFFRRDRALPLRFSQEKRQQPAFAGLPAFTIAKWVGALDTGKLNRALKGDIEAPKNAAVQVERVFAHSLVEEGPGLPSLKKASRA
jgi:hypothetical protein